MAAEVQVSLLEQMIAEMDPVARQAFHEHAEALDRSVQVRCAWGQCYYDVDPVVGKIVSGVGDPLCGCENLPGWRAARVEGRPKPGWSGKAKGRHGSRVQRSRARRREWQAMVAEYKQMLGYTSSVEFWRGWDYTEAVMAIESPGAPQD